MSTRSQVTAVGGEGNRPELRNVLYLVVRILGSEIQLMFSCPALATSIRRARRGFNSVCWPVLLYLWVDLIGTACPGAWRAPDQARRCNFSIGHKAAAERPVAGARLQGMSDTAHGACGSLRPPGQRVRHPVELVGQVAAVHFGVGGAPSDRLSDPLKWCLAAPWRSTTVLFLPRSTSS